MNVENIVGQPVNPPVEKVVLELTPDEAVILGGMLGGAHPERVIEELRPVVYKMYNVMSDAGWGHPGPLFTNRHPDLNRHKFVYEEARKLVR